MIKNGGMMKALNWLTLCAATILLAGCQSLELPGRASLGSSSASQEQYVSTDEPQRLGREQFARGNYALAERYFQSAVERFPQDGDSWTGLAASYDQLGRFDLADRAYERAVSIKGETPLILNNRGYSYLLRGNATQAELFFHRALASRPDSATINNNITILRRAAVER